MKLSEFDYQLAPELIATEPSKARDQSRLLVLDKETGAIEYKHFFDIIDYLEPGDLLIANNSKVIPARLIGEKQPDQSRPNWTNAPATKIEIFLSKHIVEPRPSSLLEKEKGLIGERRFYVPSPLRGEGQGEVWECLVKGKVKPGAKVLLSDRLTAKLIEAQANATWLVEFNLSGADFFAELDKIGQVPLPPYIIKQRSESLNITDDKTEYQTVYADDNQKGSVAAPTAGLHFTPELIAKIKAKGVTVEYLTLHVGLGTFLPVKVDNIEEHQIHSEWAEIGPKTLEAIVATKQAGKRVVAVGTTSARTLEFFKSQIPNPNDQVGDWSLDIGALSSWVDIYIYPPYQFQIVDALITNFHLPKSTLLMLVSAFAACPERGRGGKENIDQAYQEAIKERYRFYSYGDAMFIR